MTTRTGNLHPDGRRESALVSPHSARLGSWRWWRKYSNFVRQSKMHVVSQCLLYDFHRNTTKNRNKTGSQRLCPSQQPWAGGGQDRPEAAPRVRLPKHTPAGGSSSIRVAAASPARRRATASAGRSRDVGKGLVCQRQERLGWGLPVWELAGGLLATHRSVRSTGTLLGIRTRCKGGEKWTRAAGRPGLKTATLSLSVDGSHRASVRHV